MSDTPVEAQSTSAGCLNYPCRTPLHCWRCTAHDQASTHFLTPRGRLMVASPSAADRWPPPNPNVTWSGGRPLGSRGQRPRHDETRTSKRAEQPVSRAESRRLSWRFQPVNVKSCSGPPLRRRRAEQRRGQNGSRLAAPSELPAPDPKARTSARMTTRVMS